MVFSVKTDLGMAVGERSPWRQVRIRNVFDKSPHTFIGVFVYSLWLRTIETIDRVSYLLKWRWFEIVVMQASIRIHDKNGDKVHQTTAKCT
jgi:hypothetical protein